MCLVATYALWPHPLYLLVVERVTSIQICGQFEYGAVVDERVVSGVVGQPGATLHI